MDDKYKQFVMDMAHEMPYSETNVEKYNHVELYNNYMKLVRKWNTYQIRANQTMGYAINAGSLHKPGVNDE